MLYYLSDRILLVRCSSVFVCDYFEPLLCHLACITGNVQLATRILSFSEFVIDFFFQDKEAAMKKKLQQFLLQMFKMGTVRGFQHFSMYLRGKEEMGVTVYHEPQVIYNIIIIIIHLISLIVFVQLYL